MVNERKKFAKKKKVAIIKKEKAKEGKSVAYVFDKETAATFKITGGSGSGFEESLTLKGINSLVESADTIVAGIQGLLYIADRANDYNWGHGVRVVSEDVDYES